MKASIAAKLDQLSRRLGELNRFLASEDSARNLDEFRRVSREHAEITPVVERFNAYQAAEADRAAATEMLADPEMKAFGEAEVRLLTTISATLGAALENARLFDETQRLLKETERPVHLFLRIVLVAGRKPLFAP